MGGKTVGITRIVGEFLRLTEGLDSYAFVAFHQESGEFVRLTADEVKELSKRDRQLVQNAVEDNSYGPVVKWLRRLTPGRLWYRPAFRRVRRCLAKTRRVHWTKNDIFLQMGLPLSKDSLNAIRQIRLGGARILLYSHDIIPVIRPHYTDVQTVQNFFNFLDAVLDDQTGIMANSECSRRDIADWMASQGKAVAFLEVVKPGWELEPVSMVQAIRPEIERLKHRRFALFVSTIEHRKNHDLLYKALLKIIEQGDEDPPLLVFAGRAGWLVNDLMHDLRHDPRVQAHIQIVNDVNESELDALYRYCRFTVFPSLYEGWGLPVSESLSFGKFVLASDRGATPEAAMGLCELINPYDSAKWADALVQYMRDDALLQSKEATLRAAFVPRPWRVFAQEVLACARRFESGLR